MRRETFLNTRSRITLPYKQHLTQAHLAAVCHKAFLGATHHKLFIYFYLKKEHVGPTRGPCNSVNLSKKIKTKQDQKAINLICYLLKKANIPRWEHFPGDYVVIVGQNR